MNDVIVAACQPSPPAVSLDDLRAHRPQGMIEPTPIGNGVDVAPDDERL
jgi:hypothetical protein